MISRKRRPHLGGGGLFCWHYAPPDGLGVSFGGANTSPDVLGGLFCWQNASPKLLVFRW